MRFRVRALSPEPFRHLFGRPEAERAAHGIRRPTVIELPEVLLRRLLSLRGFDRDGMMLDADIVEGTAAEGLIARLLANPAIEEVHAHYARRGCYAGLITRAG